MWGTAVIVCAVLWVFAAIFLIYATADILVHWNWKQFILALLIWIAFSLAEIVLSAIAE